MATTMIVICNCILITCSVLVYNYNYKSCSLGSNVVKDWNSVKDSKRCSKKKKSPTEVKKKMKKMEGSATASQTQQQLSILDIGKGMWYHYQFPEFLVQVPPPTPPPPHNCLYSDLDWANKNEDSSGLTVLVLPIIMCFVYGLTTQMRLWNTF